MTLVQANQILRKKTLYHTKPATNFCDSSKSATGVGLINSKMARYGVSAGPSSINKIFKCLNTSYFASKAFDGEYLWQWLWL